MNHYVYEITDLVNGKKYIGKRSCRCDIKNDKYMGSGKLIKEAIKQKGIENFSKKIICVCESQFDALRKETLIIKRRRAAESELYYNIAGKNVERKIPLNIVLKEDLSEKILRIAKEDDKSINRVVNELVEMGLEIIEDPIEYKKCFGDFVFEL